MLSTNLCMPDDLILLWHSKNGGDKTVGKICTNCSHMLGHYVFYYPSAFL